MTLQTHEIAFMASTATKVMQLGPGSNGVLLEAWDFDEAEFEPGWRYELINGVLIVNPPASVNERDANEELGHWLRNYQDSHPQGKSLDCTVSEQTIRIGTNRRRADRAIWAGLGRFPQENETPTIIVEFVSKGRRSRRRDYEIKRAEYLSVGVHEYWIIDRFTRTMTVLTTIRGKAGTRTIGEQQTYSTSLLPGFELPLASLLHFTDRWPE